MSMLDLLLGAGDKILERPEEEHEVSRLSVLLGEKFIIRTRTLTMKEFNDAPVGPDRPVHIALKGTVEPDFSSAELCKKYTPSGRKTPLTPVELIKKLLLPGEIIGLYNAISEQAGFGEDAVAKIEKN